MKTGRTGTPGRLIPDRLGPFQTDIQIVPKMNPETAADTHKEFFLPLPRKNFFEFAAAKVREPDDFELLPNRYPRVRHFPFFGKKG